MSGTAPRRAWIRADASARIGHGHVMRCLALAAALRRQGVQALFLQRSQAGDAASAVVQAGFDNLAWTAADDDLIAAQQQRQDAASCLRRLPARDRPDLLVLDHYRLGAEWVRSICAGLGGPAPTVLVIDDLGDRPQLGDLLLDMNWHDDPAARYRGLWPASAASLFGPAHALLRDEFVLARGQVTRPDSDPMRLVLAFGGSDPANATDACLQRLQPALPGVHLDVIVGAGSAQRTSLVERWASVPGVELTVGASDVAARFARADLFVGAGGSMTWERACLGLPGVTLPIADNQLALCRRLAAVGEGVDLGLFGAAALDGLLPAVHGLLHDPAALRRMGQALSLRCDGRGADRVVQRLLRVHAARAPGAAGAAAT